MAEVLLNVVRKYVRKVQMSADSMKTKVSLCYYAQYTREIIRLKMSNRKFTKAVRTEKKWKFRMQCSKKTWGDCIVELITVSLTSTNTAHHPPDAIAKEGKCTSRVH